MAYPVVLSLFPPWNQSWALERKGQCIWQRVTFFLLFFETSFKMVLCKVLWEMLASLVSLLFSRGRRTVMSTLLSFGSGPSSAGGEGVSGSPPPTPQWSPLQPHPEWAVPSQHWLLLLWPPSLTSLPQLHRVNHNASFTEVLMKLSLFFTTKPSWCVCVCVCGQGRWCSWD